MEFIKGTYHDIVKRRGDPPINLGWKSNTIQPDCGKFISALFNKQYTPPIGIEYLVVGGPYNANDATTLYADADKALFASRFRDRIGRYFGQTGLTPPTITPGSSSSQILPAVKDSVYPGYWVCAVKLIADDIRYDPVIPPPASPITNQLKIDFSFQKNDLSTTTWSPPFKEFSLVGIAYQSGAFQKDSLFQINYVVQDGIYVKDVNVSLDRSIVLNFPPQ